MNSLARVVRALVTGDSTSLDTASAELSPQEQAALASLAPALRLSPRDLVVLLEQAAAPLDWAASSRSGSKRAEA